MAVTMQQMPTAWADMDYEYTSAYAVPSIPVFTQPVFAQPAPALTPAVSAFTAMPSTFTQPTRVINIQYVQESKEAVENKIANCSIVRPRIVMPRTREPQPVIDLLNYLAPVLQELMNKPPNSGFYIGNAENLNKIAEMAAHQFNAKFAKCEHIHIVYKELELDGSSTVTWSHELYRVFCETLSIPASFYVVEPIHGNTEADDMFVMILYHSLMSRNIPAEIITQDKYRNFAKHDGNVTVSAIPITPHPRVLDAYVRGDDVGAFDTLERIKIMSKYAEYRLKPSTIHAFDDNVKSSIAAWKQQ